jgi:poly(A) polymerase
MKVEGDWLNAPSTQAVLSALEDAGHQAFLVGGCVRNALLNAPVKDIDIATDARPDRVMAIARGAGFDVIPTGLDHGTVTVVTGGAPHEITTFRKDVETTGRHATVVFSDDVSQDARRRDFTMNALYARRDGSVVDPLDGLTDLRARRVRFIENAAQRIEEDYLRILRFFRFHAWYGDPDAGMDEDALAAIATHLDGLQALSRERVGSEIMRLLAAPDPVPAVAAMRAVGVLAVILPGAEDRALAPLLHLETEAKERPLAIRRLAALGGQNIASRLRLSRADAHALDVMRTEAVSTKSASELGYRLGADLARSIVFLRAAFFETSLDPGAVEDIALGEQAEFPVKAADLMPELQGPALGERLRTLENKWVSSGFALTKSELLESGQYD